MAFFTPATRTKSKLRMAIDGVSGATSLQMVVEAERRSASALSPNAMTNRSSVGYANATTTSG